MTATLLTPETPLRASPLRQAKFTPPQAFVKVNQFYLLYTYPVIPYLDKSGVLMVGLEGFTRALFAKAPPEDAQAKFYGGDDYGRVTTDVAARRETLILGDHTLTFTANSTTVQADGAVVEMDALAYWDAAARQMVVPAASLARCLGLTSAWDPARRLLSLTVPDAMTEQTVDLGGFDDFPVDTDTLVPWQAVHPTADAPAWTNYPSGTAHLLPKPTPWLLYEAKNVSGAATDEEKLDVKVLYTGAGQSGNLDGWSRIRANGWSPTIPAGGVRRFAVSLQENPIDHSFPLCVVSYPEVALP